MWFSSLLGAGEVPGCSAEQWDALPPTDAPGGTSSPESWGGSEELLGCWPRRAGVLQVLIAEEEDEAGLHSVATALAAAGHSLPLTCPPRASVSAVKESGPSPVSPTWSIANAIPPFRP